MGSAATTAADAGLGKRADRFLATVPIYPVVLVAYAVLRLYSDNLDDVEAGSVLLPLLLTVLLASAGYVLLARIWGDARRAALVATAIVVPFLSFGLIADLVAPAWPHEPIVRAYLVALLAWIVIIAGAFYLATKLGGRLATLTQGLNVLSIALLVLAIVPIAGHALGSSSDGNPPSTEPEASALVVPADLAASERRDIYHLVFDRYGSDVALDTGLGIDNSGFSDWLADGGFSLVEDARANYERTALSLSSTHSMGLHDTLAARMGASSSELGPLYDLIANSAAASLLQDLGYEYYHVGSWFHPTASSDIADHVVKPAFEVTFASTLLDQTAITGLREIASMVTTLSAHGTLEQQASVTEQQWTSLASIAAEPGPKYVFAHLLVPHDPYMFLADGSFDPDRASFETQLEYANAQVRALVEPLLQLPPDEQPIIILQADEGPYPTRYSDARDDFDWTTATPEELATKFGVLNAMYLPGPAGEEPLPSGITLVNTYPELFERYFGIGVARAPDRTYAIGPQGPYDMLDLTDELADAQIESMAGGSS